MSTWQVRKLYPISVPTSIKIGVLATWYSGGFIYEPSGPRTGRGLNVKNDGYFALDTISDDVFNQYSNRLAVFRQAVVTLVDRVVPRGLDNISVALRMEF